MKGISKISLIYATGYFFAGVCHCVKWDGCISASESDICSRICLSPHPSHPVWISTFDFKQSSAFCAFSQSFWIGNHEFWRTVSNKTPQFKLWQVSTWEVGGRVLPLAFHMISQYWWGTLWSYLSHSQTGRSSILQWLSCSNMMWGNHNGNKSVSLCMDTQTSHHMSLLII